MTAPSVAVTAGREREGVPAQVRRVLVCGGRDFSDRHLLCRTLDELAEVDAYGIPRRHIRIIHGACPTGADMLADKWAASVWATVSQFPADWDKHGRAAGPLRNARMIAEGNPDLVIAFPGGRGTADMVRKARAAGIPVREIPSPSEVPAAHGDRAAGTPTQETPHDGP